ncbi:MAG: DUF423 domain-containing protein [Planctomycetota bacterium]
MHASRWIAIGALWAAIGVALGAFGAHALREELLARGELATWQTAVQYQMWHALAIVLAGILGRARRGFLACAALFLLGSLCFSGSLYLLAFDLAAELVWPFTPLGGALLIVGWLLFAAQALRGAAGERGGEIPPPR